MSWFGLGKNETKVYKERDLKAHLKSGLIRLNLRKNKAQTAVQKGRKDISVLLKNGDDEKARIIAEQTMKEENLVSAFEELTALCEEVLARLGIVTANKRLPIDLKEPICTLIWSSARIDIKEFGLIREQFALRFGANLDHEALCNIENCVSEVVIKLLSPEPPIETTVFAYLKNIAIEFNIEWGFDEDLDVPESSLQDIYGFALGDAKQPDSENNIESGTLGLSIDDFPDIKNTSVDSFGSVGSEKQNFEESDDLDAFEKMFAPIPDTATSITSVKNIGVVAAPVIQKIVPITPQKVTQNIQTVQQVQRSPIVQTGNTTTPKPAVAVKNLQMSQELAQMSDKDLEAEFEQLFNCPFNDSTEAIEPIPASSSINPKTKISLEKSDSSVSTDFETPKEQAKHSNIQLEKSSAPSPTQVRVNEAEFTTQLVSTATSSEYDDLFSSPNPTSEKEIAAPVDMFPASWDSVETSAPPAVQENDYDDIFERLSSVSSSKPQIDNWESTLQQTEENIDGIEEMTNEEWAARFDSSSNHQMLDPSSFDFTFQSTEQEPEAPATNENAAAPDSPDDDLMRRFMAL